MSFAGTLAAGSRGDHADEMLRAFVVPRGRRGRLDEGKVVDDAPCPIEAEQMKQSLAQDIISESHSVAGAKRVHDQAPTPAAPAAGGCTKDTDCKGDRVCVKGDCVDPAPKTP